MSAEPNKRPSLTAAFQKAARRHVGALLMTVGLVTGCATTINGQTPAQAAVPPQDTITNVITNDPDSLNQARQDSIYRAEVRNILLADARLRYPELAEHATTGYSRELATLQDSLRQYLSRSDTSLHSTIVILDPAKIDVAVALTVPLRKAITEEIAKHGKPLSEDAVTAMIRNSIQTYRSPSGIPTYAPNPTAYPNMDGGEPRPCMIVPHSDHALTLTVPGFTYAQQIKFANTHEGWHCLDNRYRMTAVQLAAMDTLNPSNLENIIEHPVIRGAASIIHLKESVADVASLGDMVRGGEGTDIIDHAIRWRNASMPRDFMHHSVPALEALKAHIDSVGLAAFRKADPVSTRELYFSINDAHALTEPRLLAAAQYVMGDDAARDSLKATALTDPDVLKGIQYGEKMRGVELPRNPIEDLIVIFAPTDTALRTKMMEWGVVEKLEGKALEIGAKITPETLIKAYGAIQTDLHAELVAGRDEAVNREKMTLLKALFTRYVRAVDYVGVNKHYGVDIEEAEKTVLSVGRANAALFMPAVVGPRPPAAPPPEAGM